MRWWMLCDCELWPVPFSLLVCTHWSAVVILLPVHQPLLLLLPPAWECWHFPIQPLGLVGASLFVLCPWLWALPDRFPAVNSLIQRINLRKRRDSLILGGVVGVCTILLLLYAFHWWLLPPGLCQTSSPPSLLPAKEKWLGGSIRLAQPARGWGCQRGCLEFLVVATDTGLGLKLQCFSSPAVHLPLG